MRKDRLLCRHWFNEGWVDWMLRKDGSTYQRVYFFENVSKKELIARASEG